MMKPPEEEGTATTVSRKKVIRTETRTRAIKTTTSSATNHHAVIIDLNPVLLRLLLLHLLLLFLICLHILVMVHDYHVLPYLKVAQWTQEKESTHQTTYPYFDCSEQDITTNRTEDLFVNPDSSIERAIDIVRWHGMGVFPNVISNEQDALRLREFILWRNERLDASESIPLIGMQNRWSFALDIHEAPIITQVLRSIGSSNNRLLKAVLENLLGPNPALVTATTITAAAGAEAQYFHGDTVTQASSIRYGHDFVPMYTLLIPLQDTSPSMGPTSVCPGTHRCGSAPACAQGGGFPIYNESLGYWPAGYGLLYDAQAQHRGSAHLEGPHRVALLLTWASRPDHAYTPAVFSRSLPIGAIWIIRWDMWGQCWNNLQSLTESTPIWIRALGISKPPDADWGWTFWRALAFRITNDQFGYRLIDLEAIVRYKVTWLGRLPFFLQGRIVDNTGETGTGPFHVYLKDVLLKFRNLFAILNVVAIGLYLSFALSSSSKEQKRSLIMKLVVSHGLGLLLGLTVWSLVQGSEWGSGTLQIAESPAAYFSKAHHEEWYLQQLAAPDYGDVLVTKSKRPYVRRFLQYHPANRRFHEIVSSFSPGFMAYRSNPSLLNALIESIIDETYSRGRTQFLEQTAIYGDWVEMSRSAVHEYTKVVALENMLRRPFKMELTATLVRLIFDPASCCEGPNLVTKGSHNKGIEWFSPKGLAQRPSPAMHLARKPSQSIRVWHVGDNVEVLGPMQRQWMPASVIKIIDNSTVEIRLDASGVKWQLGMQRIRPERSIRKTRVRAHRVALASVAGGAVLSSKL